jgi:hypothetical protein
VHCNPDVSGNWIFPVFKKPTIIFLKKTKTNQRAILIWALQSCSARRAVHLWPSLSLREHQRASPWAQKATNQHIKHPQKHLHTYIYIYIYIYIDHFTVPNLDCSARGSIKEPPLGSKAKKSKRTKNMGMYVCEGA